MGYWHWLHGRWPAGTVERLPEVREGGATAVPGLWVAGDLTGVPLLKLAADGGAAVIEAIARALGAARSENGPLDVAIVGAGVSGISAALAAKKAGLRFAVYESVRPFATIAAFPRAKPIFTYPTELVPRGELALTADVKEALFDELEAQRTAANIEPVLATVDHVARKDGALALVGSSGEVLARARHVVVALGKSGAHRTLGVPGEERGHVSNRLHDARDFAGEDVLVVGGGDSALETACLLDAAGARVTLVHRKRDFARAKPENVARLAASKVVQKLGASVHELAERDAVLRGADGAEERVAATAVFTMLGREAPLDFFRRSGVPIRGEWRPSTWATMAAFVALTAFVYVWKSGGALTQAFERHDWFPFFVPALLGDAGRHPETLLGTLALTLKEPGFYYSLAYTVAVLLFGVRRIRRRKTPYVTRQTVTLIAVQLVPLFLLPYLVLPWLGHAGAFDHGLGRTIADNLFPAVTYGQGREYWRAFGLVLAWPLFVWNFFTPHPMTWWLVIGCVQTFVVIPAIVWRWGKGAYCGWVCSCGALAETLGDDQREKMPHGPGWTRANAVGQVVLGAAALLFALRIVSWAAPRSGLGHAAGALFDRLLAGNVVLGVSLDYYHLVDVFLAGIVGVGLYFWLSGRVWCRFACPLAALMHVYARFSRFRIFAEKKKCISCNACTSVCHQGIDVMAFAQKGLPMEDPQCVRCSACVQSCPTGTLSFGRLGTGGTPVLDALAASPVQRTEGKRRLPIAH